MLTGRRASWVAIVLATGGALATESVASEPGWTFRVGPVAPLAPGLDGCHSAPTTFTRQTTATATDAPDWCVGLGADPTAGEAPWQADVELPSGTRVATETGDACAGPPCAASTQIGTLQVRSQSQFGAVEEIGGVFRGGPGRVLAVFGPPTGDRLVQAGFELLTGVYGGQVVRIAAWPGSRDTEVGEVRVALDTLAIRWWSPARRGALVSEPSCEVAQQARLTVRPAQPGPLLAGLSDTFALDGCAGTPAGARALGPADTRPAAVDAYFATQRARPGRISRTLGTLRSVLVPEAAVGTEVAAQLTTPGRRPWRARASVGASGALELVPRPPAAVTKGSRLTLRVTAPAGSSVQQHFAFVIRDRALRTKRLTETPSTPRSSPPPPPTPAP